MKHSHTINCFNDPSLGHLDLKIFAWLIGTVLLGLILSVVLTDGTDDDKYLRQRQQQRSIRQIQLRPMRTVRNIRGLRKKAA